jgi:hypothetical protein
LSETVTLILVVVVVLYNDEMVACFFEKGGRAATWSCLIAITQERVQMQKAQFRDSSHTRCPRELVSFGVKNRKGEPHIDRRYARCCDASRRRDRCGARRRLEGVGKCQGTCMHSNGPSHPAFDAVMRFAKARDGIYVLWRSFVLYSYIHSYSTELPPSKTRQPHNRRILYHQTAFLFSWNATQCTNALVRPLSKTNLYTISPT